jgi:hypothetical protein
MGGGGAGVVVTVPPHAEVIDAATSRPAVNQAENPRSPTPGLPPDGAVIVNVNASVLPIVAVLWSNDAENDSADAALDAQAKAHAITTASNAPASTRFI